MFRALLCSSSGVRDYAGDYHIGRIVLGLLCVGSKVQLGWSSARVAGLGLQPGQHTANQERYDHCSNQQHCREFVMMGIVMLETC